MIHVCTIRARNNRDYAQDPNMKKAMVQFYTKAKAYEQLASLLNAWSDSEAVEGDYERAIRWLHEAKKYGQKAEQWESSQQSMQIERKIKSTNSFLSAREISSSDPAQARTICIKLLDDVDGSVQPGDCYALLLELETDCMKAYEYIKAMSAKGIAPEEYIDEETIVSICKGANRDWKRGPVDDSGEEESDDSLESSDILALDEKDQSIMDSAINRDWNPVRDQITKRGSDLSLKLVCCICSTGPPQSVTVAIMRAKSSIFAEKDAKRRYPLHYLCYHGAPTYTIIFAVQRHKAALQQRDEDNKTPLDYLMTMPWEYCAEDKDEAIEELQRTFNLKLR